MMSGFDQRYPDLSAVRNARRAYYAAVSYIDDQIGQIIQRLKDLNLADKTVILVTSDHGDMLGEKGLWFKMSPYEESSRVPLIITGPDHLVPKGRFANPVSLIDLLPTLVELADAPNAATAGTSLLEIAREEQNGQMGPQDRDVFVEYLAEGTHAPQITLVRGQYKYIVCPGDPDQHFDLETDPHELHNVADSQDYREIAQGLRSKLDTRYNFQQLETAVLNSQKLREVVARALQQGNIRHWDLIPDAQQRYVRGDFWSALHRGQIRRPQSD